MLGYLPYIVAGLYGVYLILILYKNSNKLYTEIIPIAFLGFAFASGIVLPFVFKQSFSHMFCTTIMIALFVYYVFSIHQLSKKDPLTGVLNLQAFYNDSAVNREDIIALISMDMNGLKKMNSRQALYRIGGDEFVIICRNTTEKETAELVEQIRKEISKTKYSSSIGYCYSENKNTPISDMLKESDQNMYADKAKYYSQSGMDRRRRSSDVRTGLS